MAAENQLIFVTHTHYEEYGPNPNASEPGHCSANGMSLRTWNGFAHDTGLAIIPEAPADAPNDDPAVIAALEALKTAVGFSADISVISEQEMAFYRWFLFDRIRFNDLPTGIDGLVGDGYYNRGNIYLNDLRELFGVPIPATGHAVMDDALLAAINASYARSPVQTIYAMAYARFAKQMVNKDFTEKSAVVAGKTKGDGRANRMNNILRWALEMIGIPAIADLFHAPPITVPPQA